MLFVKLALSFVFVTEIYDSTGSCVRAALISVDNLYVNTGRGD